LITGWSETATPFRYSGDVPLIALTGGIAAGKSTVATRLRELGAHVISADELVRFVQRGGSPTLDLIRERFGLGVIGADGELERAALGRLVFDDGIARKDLENIVHPAIGAEFRTRVAEIHADDPNAIIVYDIPLLIESKRVDEFDAVIVIACDPQIRHDRLVSLRGLSSDEAWSRITSQASEDERRAVADWIIESGESIESTLAQTDRVWAQLVDAYRV
jgi:dephospho-CoA kinase